MNATGSLFVNRSTAPDSFLRSCQQKDVSITALEVKGWTRLQLKSAEPLLGEPETSSPLHYYYSFLFRQGGKGRFLLVSEHTELVVILLKRLGMNAQVRPPEIKVKELVNHLATKPSLYVMSAVYAHIEGYGQALKSIAFYGSDVGETVLFRQLLPQLTPHRVSLRDVSRRAEILSIGARGEISFSYITGSSLIDVDHGMRFLSGKGYLNWEMDDESWEGV